MGDGTEQNPYTRDDVLRLIEENGGKAEWLNLSEKWFEEGIDLHELNLEGIVFADAYLEEAYLSHAHLKGADLRKAHLKGAKLYDTHLEGANLWGAELSPKTSLEDVDWGNYILGEENDGHFEIAADTYRRLKIWYTNAGMYDVAGKFFYREMEAKRKALSWKQKPHLKLWNWILRLLCGYGENWERVVIWAIGIIVGLAIAYYLWGSFNPSSFWDTLYYSVVSFVALGYGNWAPQPTGWAKGMGAAEAVIGVFMMALFLVTFTRKMTR